MAQSRETLEADLHEALLLLEELVGVVLILRDGQAMPLKGIGERALDLLRRHNREPRNDNGAGDGASARPRRGEQPDGSGARS